jgi:folate-binding protein YgfZ
MQSIDLDEWRRVLVTGSDAMDWLEDLVSAWISRVRPDDSVRSLLLTPTGRIRADFHVTPYEDGYLLIQDAIQPVPIDELLSRYVLSSDVKLVNRDEPRTGVWHGDAISPGTEHTGMTLDEFDVWRIRQGIPRFGIDLHEDSLPQEAGWERFIDFTKGCFMGQEAMAKIRNMGGHPTRVVRPMHAAEKVVAGEAIVAGGKQVGVVTSAAETDVMARVSWDAGNAELRTENGVELSDRA